MLVARVLYLIAKITRKESDILMIALFLANQIIAEQLKFKDVPRVFKEKVRQILTDLGVPELATEE